MGVGVSPEIDPAVIDVELGNASIPGDSTLCLHTCSFQHPLFGSPVYSSSQMCDNNNNKKHSAYVKRPSLLWYSLGSVSFPNGSQGLKAGGLRLKLHSALASLHTT